MRYEWYEIVENDELQQGDIIRSCLQKMESPALAYDDKTC